MENKTLQKIQSSYNLIIPQKVENKIRTLLGAIYNTEWSGVLFYTFSGSFKTKDLELVCHDILPMDIGSAVYTEWNMDESVISYMVDNDLLDCQLGLVHSHHSMETFFSGTDMNTLEEEGKERNNFLSLIVNNAKHYSACITEREIHKIKKHSNIVMPFFGEQEFDSREEEKEEEEVEVKYHQLNIKFECEDAAIAELNKTIDKLQEEKRKKVVVNLPKEYKFTNLKEPTLFDVNSFNKPSSAAVNNFQVNKENKYDLDDTSWLTDPNYPPKDVKKEEKDEIFDYADDMEFVDECVAKLITGNLLVTCLSKNLDKEIPVLNKLWKKGTDEDIVMLNSIVFELVNAVIPVGPDSSSLTLACAERIEELFEGKDFYPYDTLLNTLYTYDQ